ncbi:hypothetical protein BDP27DRAFT_1459815 [Rhodocollybia butyracea]|uniref:Uncharacterized protein n=1 Tax=Rhodocollybia butyracea TaxID=206335 RepID=A0A9P5UFR0_9AGAR|nr:hypothetical protein BDP27DRAFT_1459815 [Rhodocollybia butyracea]
MFREERALGFQLRCPDCASGAGSKSENKAKEESGEILEEETVRVCTSTTNAIFWEKWQHYEIPRGIPHFSKRCALTRELYDFIVEVHPSLTSGGMAEHIKRELFTILGILVLISKSQSRVLSFDHTFRTARKANIISSDGDLSNPLKGGLFDVINEDNEIVYWVSAFK